MLGLDPLPRLWQLPQLTWEGSKKMEQVKWDHDALYIIIQFFYLYNKYISTWYSFPKSFLVSELSMWITGTITCKAKSEGKSFSPLLSLQVDFWPLHGLHVDLSLPPEDQWPGTNLQTAQGPGNFASLFGLLMTGVSVPLSLALVNGACAR